MHEPRPPGVLPGAKLVALLQEEQRACWGRGEPLPVEDLLARHPGLREDPGALLDLVFNEVLCREGQGESPTPEEYQARFPHLAAEIAEHFAVHRALGTGSLTGEGDGPSPSSTQPLGPAGQAARPDGAPLPAVPGYAVLGVLGTGAMGVVFKARQEGLGRVVALKMIRDGALAGPAEVARFRREAEAAARLQHPNIVQIHEVGDCAGRPFFSLECVEGGSLADRLRGSPLPPREAARLLDTLARAVHAAHAQQVVHRDLKPANVLLAADSTPKVADFGLAKQLDAKSGQTASGALVGTPSYMAPEQARGRGRDVGPAADVYGLGAILYELLTGRPPFQAPSVAETLQQVLLDDPVPPRLPGLTARAAR
jgi:serine/threonine-protein kinase